MTFSTHCNKHLKQTVPIPACNTVFSFKCFESITDIHFQLVGPVTASMESSCWQHCASTHDSHLMVHPSGAQMLPSGRERDVWDDPEQNSSGK
jgi:hypothetical protein